MERRLVRWMLFLSARTKERLEELSVKEPAIQKAMTTLEFLSQDEETRRLYEERQRALRDYASAIEGAREEGREEGQQEGLQKVVREMLDDDLPLPAIAKYTGLSVKEIEKLRDDIH